MSFKIVAEASPNSFAFENSALIKPSGFREYDARWWFGHPGSDREPDLNLIGVQALGMGLGTLIRRLGAGRDIVTGHDFRSYSMAIKLALVSGLMAAGARVKDVGLALSPMAYFAQFALDTQSVAMVTASHNENGWTGVKMGAARPLTFGPDEMSALREIVLLVLEHHPRGSGLHHSERRGRRRPRAREVHDAFFQRGLDPEELEGDHAAVLDVLVHAQEPPARRGGPVLLHLDAVIKAGPATLEPREGVQLGRRRVLRLRRE